MLVDHSQVEPRVVGGECRESLRRIVGGVVVHHHALPLVARSILLRHRTQRLDQTRGAIISGYYQRKSQHNFLLSLMTVYKYS